ncbi:hypothetical protein ACVWZV_003347 [Bradyrhizobium sp. GM5.1]
MIEYIYGARALFYFTGYLPQPLTLRRIGRWIQQFKPDDRKHVTGLLKNIIYLSEKRVRRILLEQNQTLMERLAQAGLPPEKLIYVQVHEAGSSSPVMLNLLRDAAGLEQRGCRFLDANDTLGVNKVTNELAEGALIYVDDFVGTGTQFCQARDFTAKYVEGTFSEFLIAPCICEEGIYPLGERGIEAFAGHVHSKSERPLHPNSHLLDKATKKRLVEICQEINPYMGLGWLDSAVMVVLYRNAPDNIPILFRGSEKQDPYVGIFPRTTDLPICDLS